METGLHKTEHSMEFTDFSNVSLFLNVSLMIENLTRYYDNQQENTDILLDLVLALDTYCIPVLLLVGIVLNIILVATIRLSDLKNVPVCFCFMSLGIIDTIYLVAMGIPWLSKLNVDIYNTKGFCQLTYYLNILTAFLSSWYIVIILIERGSATYMPNRASKLFSAFRTKCYVTFFSIFSIVAHLYLTWTSGVYEFHNMSHCMVIFEHMEDIIIMRKIDIFFSFVLPVGLCVVISTAIFYIMHFGHVKHSDNELKRQQPAVTEVSFTLKHKGVKSISKYSSISENTKKERKQRIRETSRSKRLTYTCLAISKIYMILIVPHNVLKMKMTFSTSDYDVTVISRYLQILEKIYALNFVYKALVYFILMPEMRRCFVGLLLTLCKIATRRHVKHPSTAV